MGSTGLLVADQEVFPAKRRFSQGRIGLRVVSSSDVGIICTALEVSRRVRHVVLVGAGRESRQANPPDGVSEIAIAAPTIIDVKLANDGRATA